MPQSIVRFLRVYASVVMLLVAGVIAIGTEPVAARANFGNVEAAFAHRTSRPAMRIVSFDGNWQDAKFTLAIDASVLRDALPLSAFRSEHSAPKRCAQRGLRVRHHS